MVIFRFFGMQRKLRSASDLIQNCMATARRIVYSLMPADLHGENGLSPVASRKLIVYTVRPWCNRPNQIRHPVSWYFLQKSPKGILSLREGVASEAIFLLSGLIPYAAITRLYEGASLQNVPTRQVSVPPQKRGSWFQYIKEKASMYDIAETLLGSLINPWKPMLGMEKICLRNRPRLLVWQAPPWSTTEIDSLTYGSKSHEKGYTSPYLAKRGCRSGQHVAASFRAKMLSSTYILQANRARFNQFEVGMPTVLGSQGEPGPLCPDLPSPGQGKIPYHMSLTWKYLEELSISIPTSPEEKCTLLMNCGTSYKCRLCKGAGYKRHPYMQRQKERQ